EAHRAEPGRPAREVVDQPAERDRLDPEPEVREQRAGPEEAVVRRAAEGAEHGTRKSPRGSSPGQMQRGRDSAAASVSETNCTGARIPRARSSQRPRIVPDAAISRGL